MKKYFFILLTALISINAKSQNKTLYAEYTIYANTENPKIFNSILKANNKESFYVIQFGKQDFKIVDIDNSNFILKPATRDQITYINKEDSLVTTLKYKRRKFYKINEKLTNFSWKINPNETKIISNYRCIKATVEFRGRKYIAWYSPEIPVFSAPYKFHGLLGLVFEIYDETKRFHWMISKFRFLDNDKIENISFDKNQKYISLSLREFVELQEGKRKEESKKAKSKLPRGVKMTRTNNRNGIEIEYEWEN